MENTTIGLLVVAFAWAFAWMASRISENWIRKKAIETGATPEEVRRMFEEEEPPHHHAALRWGMVLIALGMGVVLEAVLPYTFADPMAYGVLLVLGGAALTAYYAYVKGRK